MNEPAHLLAGLSHWEFGRFDLYRVNPPLVRMVAALPVMVAGYSSDWQGFHDRPGARPVLTMYHGFCERNGSRTADLITIARFACIPFSVAGGLTCFLWAKQLFGQRAGLLASAMWCVSPNILGHGALITADAHATSLGFIACYSFWKWLKEPTWRHAICAGLLLGVALLAKFTLCVLCVVWPCLVVIDRLSNKASKMWTERLRDILMHLAIATVAIAVVNIGYGFEETGARLGDFHFVSDRLTESKDGLRYANRFRGSVLAEIPVIVPANYLRGIDIQLHDMAGRNKSYLFGDVSQHGWWYYYLIGIAVKVPLGTWMVAILVAIASVHKSACNATLPLVSPGLALFVLVSSHTEYNEHLRYVLPAFPFAVVWISSAARAAVRSPLLMFALTWNVASSMAVYPHSLSYFNELTGGPTGGDAYFIHSNIDWGQDLLLLDKWRHSRIRKRPLYLAFFGPCSPVSLGLSDFQSISSTERDDGTIHIEAGWYAISVNCLRLYQSNKKDAVDARVLRHFLALEPTERVGYSICIYYVSPDNTSIAVRRLDHVG